MNDQQGDNADLPTVNSTSAIALGRMNAKSTLGQLEKYYTGGPPVDGINYAAAWSIREITGREFPPAEARIVRLSGFSLKPNAPRLAEGEEESSGK